MSADQSIGFAGCMRRRSRYACPVSKRRVRLTGVCGIGLGGSVKDKAGIVLLQRRKHRRQ